jgi:hypothetical protein
MAPVPCPMTVANTYTQADRGRGCPPYHSDVVLPIVIPLRHLGQLVRLPMCLYRHLWTALA